MTKLSEIDLGSALLSIFILLGFIATALAMIKISIIAINYIKVNFPKKEEENDQIKPNESNKGF